MVKIKVVDVLVELVFLEEAVYGGSHFRTALVICPLYFTLDTGSRAVVQPGQAHRRNVFTGSGGLQCHWVRSHGKIRCLDCQKY